MSTKERLLALLEENRGCFLSGEEAAEALGVSRTAVWKAVNALRSLGYAIDAVSNKGYSLSENADILCAGGIEKHLHDGGLRIQVLPSASSTNTLLREQANAGAPEGLVILANTQTRGHGRYGRSFFSPADSGLYMSLLLRPHGYSPEQAASLTTMAAVAACEAIEAVSGCKAAIKWVNDVLIAGKKVCGILTEGAVSLENQSMEYVVLGIGINVYPPREGFPEELQEIAGFVLDRQQADGKNALAAGFLNRFMGYYRRNDRDYAQAYRERSVVIGREIDVIVPSGSRRALALDIDRDCRLLVRYENGEIARLSSGEVSIRRV